VALETARRKRTAAPLLRDEDLDLTINELMRIRERPDSRPKAKVKSKKAKVKSKKGKKRINS
jgi:hypothetical protein